VPVRGEVVARDLLFKVVTLWEEETGKWKEKLMDGKTFRGKVRSKEVCKRKTDMEMAVGP
jgi:hypothetical protein